MEEAEASGRRQPDDPADGDILAVAAAACGRVPCRCRSTASQDFFRRTWTKAGKGLPSAAGDRQCCGDVEEEQRHARSQSASMSGCGPGSNRMSASSSGPARHAAESRAPYASTASLHHSLAPDESVEMTVEQTASACTRDSRRARWRSVASVAWLGSSADRMGLVCSLGPWHAPSTRRPAHPPEHQPVAANSTNQARPAKLGALVCRALYSVRVAHSE